MFGVVVEHKYNQGCFKCIRKELNFNRNLGKRFFLAVKICDFFKEKEAFDIFGRFQLTEIGKLSEIWEDNESKRMAFVKENVGSEWICEGQCYEIKSVE